MGRTGRAALLVLGILVYATLAGCGGNGNGGVPPPPLFFADIPSDPRSDGDVARDVFTGTSRGVAISSSSGFVVLAGIDPLAIPEAREFRGFLSFPFDGVSGGDTIPVDADVQVASISFQVNFIDFNTSVFFLMDQVSYPPFLLDDIDFDAAPVSAFVKDFNVVAPVPLTVTLDVTDMMREAIRLGLDDLQVRFFIDRRFSFQGRIEIEDFDPVPVLSVDYF